MSGRSTASLLICLVLPSASARAAALDDVLAAALQADPALLSLQAQAQSARAEVGVSRAALLPQVTATAGYTRNQVAAEFTTPGSTDPIVVQPLDQLEATVRADVPLVDGAAWVSLRQAGSCRDAELAQLRDAQQQVLLGVVQQAWDLETARAREAALTASVDVARALEAQATDRLALGTGDELELLQARSDVFRAEDALREAQLNRRTAARQLANRTGVDAWETPLTARVGPAGELSIDAVPAVVAAEGQMACRKQALDAQRLGYLPTLAAFGQERLSNATGFAGRVDNWAVGLSARWTLLDGGARESRLTTAAAGLHQAQAETQQARDAALEALTSARETVQWAERSIEAAAARLEAAQRGLEVSQDRLEVGLASPYDVRLASQELEEAALAVATAHSRYAVGVETLRVASGQPLVSGGEL